MTKKLTNSIVAALEREPFFRYGLIAGIAGILALHFVGPKIDIDWPLIGLIGLALIIFYFPTITRMVLPGGLEIHRELNRAQQLVQTSVAAEQPIQTATGDAAASDDSAARPPEPERPKDLHETLLDIFEVSPNAAAMEMGRLIEEAVSNLIFIYGRGTKPRIHPVPRKLTYLLQQEVIDRSTASATLEVWRLRNQAVHGHAMSDDDILRFLDIGMTVMDALSAAAMKNWQVSAPRYPSWKVHPGQTVQLGLRRKFGGEDEMYYFSCYVFDPNNQPATASAVVQADKWAYLQYPAGFPGGSTAVVGVYRVRYEILGTLIATDSFEVSPTSPE